jgi:hypothetical protein
MQTKLSGIISVDFDMSGKLLIVYSAFVKWEYNGADHHLFIGFKKAYDSVRREVLYNILIESGIPMKLVGLIKICLNETYNGVWVGKHMSDMFPVKNGLKKRRNFITIVFQLCFRICHYQGSGKPAELEIKYYTSASGLC